MFEEYEEKPIQQRGGNHLLLLRSGKTGGTMCITVEEQMTTSAASEVLFVKDVDSPVCPVMRPKRTHDVRKFLKHCDKGDHSI